MIKRLSTSFGLLAAGIASSFLLAGGFPSTALAWDISSLPAGFHVINGHQISGTTCNFYYVIETTSGPFDISSNLCTDSLTLQADIDSFVDAHVCVVNPAADQPLCNPTTSTTTTTTPSTTVVVTLPATTTTVASTTTSTTTQTTTVTTPGQQTTPGQTTTASSQQTVSTVTVTTANLDLGAALNLIQERLDELDARVTALEAQVGVIIGEEKNEPPFTNPA